MKTDNRTHLLFQNIFKQVSLSIVLLKCEGKEPGLRLQFSILSLPVYMYLHYQSMYLQKHLINAASI